MGIFNEHSFNQQQFGRGAQGAPGIGFNLTADGNYDMSAKRLTNVGAPTSNADSATKKYVDDTKVDGSVFLKLDGTRTMTGNLDMNNNRVYNLPNPTGPEQPVTLTFGDQTYLRVNGTNSMTQPLNMNNKKIINLQTPVINTDAATKKYVDDKINSPHLDLSPFLKKDGSIPLSGNLNLNQNKILNLQAPTANNDAATKKYVDDKTSHPQNDPSSFLKKDGSITMTGNLNMGGNKLINLQTPSADTDATNRKYVDDLVAQTHVQPSHYKNEFAFLMTNPSLWTDEIGDRTSFTPLRIVTLPTNSGNFHDFNHKALNIRIFKNFQGGYKYKMGLNFFTLPGGNDYTFCLEILNRDYLLWHKSIISVDHTSSQGLQFDNVAIKKLQHRYTDSRGQTQFMYYHRIIINFRKLNNQSRYFIHVLVNIPQVGNDLAVYPVQFDGVYTIAYGIMSRVSNIDPDKVYDYHTGFNVTPTKVVLNLDVNANNKKILNINADLSQENSAATVGMVKELIPFTTNYVYTQYFEDFYDFTDATNYKLVLGSFGTVLTGVNPNLNFASRKDLSFITTDGLRNLNYVINFTKKQSSNFTICIVFQLWFNRNFSLQTSSASRGGILFLKFIKNINKFHLSRGIVTREITLPHSFNGKNVVIWLTGSGNSNIIKAGISNNPAKVTINAPMDFASHNFSFKTEDGIIKKFMYSPNFYDFDSEQYHRIMLQEKINGSYVL